MVPSEVKSVPSDDLGSPFFSQDKATTHSYEAAARRGYLNGQDLQHFNVCTKDYSFFRKSRGIARV